MPATDRERSSYLSARKGNKHKFSAETKKSRKKKSSRRRKQEKLLQKSNYEPSNHEKIKHKKSTNSAISDILRTPISKKNENRKLSNVTSKTSKKRQSDLGVKLGSAESKMYKLHSGKKSRKTNSPIFDPLKSLNKTALSKKSTKERNYQIRGSDHSLERNNLSGSDKGKEFSISNNLSLKNQKTSKRRKNLGKNSVYEKILHSNGVNSKRLGDLNGGMEKQLLGHKSVDLPGNQAKQKVSYNYASQMIN